MPAPKNRWHFHIQASGCGTVNYFITRTLNGNFDQLLQIPASTTPLKLAQLNLPIGAYGYTISACKASTGKGTACSPDSAPLAVQVVIAGGLSPPQNVAVPATGLINVAYRVTWNAVASAHHYKVREESGNNTVFVDNIGALFQGFQHNIDETYTYYVQACTAANVCSAPSTPVSIRLACTGANCGSRSNKVAGILCYVHTDQLGSPIAETDAAGSVTARFRYEAFGQSLEANVAQGPGYTGHVADAASGLMYMQQRYYDPVIGRFLSTDPDPVNGLGTNFNRYAYVGNNPYRYVDPDGRANAYGITVQYASDFERTNAPTRRDQNALKASQRAVDLTINAVDNGKNEAVKADAKIWNVTVSPDRKIGTKGGVADTTAYRADVESGDPKSIDTEFGSGILGLTNESQTNNFSDGLSAKGGDASLLTVGAHELSHGAEGNIDLDEKASENDVRPRIKNIVDTSPDVQSNEVTETRRR
jgi:RHS repeat-associated protein